MATSKIKKSLQFQGGETAKGIPTAVENDHAVPKSQLDTVAATKQDNLTGGSCIEIDNNVINFLIGSTGTDHSELILNGSGFGSLDGTYALMTYNGSFSQTGQNFDLIIGGSDNVYSKEVNASTWAVLGKRGSYWWTALTNTDPSSVTQNVDDMIVGYLSVDNYLITQGSEQDSVGDNAPASSSDRIDYAIGGNPGGIIVQNGKAVLDFANSIANGASSNVYAADMIKQYLDEQDDFYKLAHNQVFSNAVASLAGNPANNQAAMEALKALCDTISSTVSSNQTAASTEYGNIDKLQTALGSTTNDLGTTHATLTDNATAKALIDELAVLIAAVRTDAETSLGNTLGNVLNAVGGSVPDGLDYKGVLAYLAQELSDLGADQFTRMPIAHFYHFAGVGFELTAGQVAGTEPFNSAGYTLNDIEGNMIGAETTDLSGLTYDARILIDYGIGGHIDAGIWERDKDTGFLTRATYFDESTEITKGAHVKVLYGGVIAGADFAVVNASDPVIGADPIEFLLDDYLRLGDGTVGKVKFDDALSAEFEALPRHVGPTAYTVPANGFVTVPHGLLKGSPFTIYDTVGNDLSDAFEVDATVAGQLVITSGDDADVDIVVTVVGKRV